MLLPLFLLINVYGMCIVCNKSDTGIYPCRSGLRDNLFPLSWHDSVQPDKTNYMGVPTMRTNIVIDDKLLDEAFSVSSAKTKKDLIHEALRMLIRLRKRKDLTELAGLIDFDNLYDHKALRKMRA